MGDKAKPLVAHLAGGFAVSDCPVARPGPSYVCSYIAALGKVLLRFSVAARNEQPATKPKMRFMRIRASPNVIASFPSLAGSLSRPHLQRVCRLAQPHHAVPVTIQL